MGDDCETEVWGWTTVTVSNAYLTRHGMKHEHMPVVLRMSHHDACPTREARRMHEIYAHVVSIWCLYDSAHASKLAIAVYAHVAYVCVAT